MAKGKSFLGLKRGQAAGLVFSVGMNGSGKKQQVVRGVAESVANPKSLGQAMNRSYLGGASKLVALFDMIADHAIEGIPFGQPNRSQFLKNVLKLEESSRPFSFKGETPFYVPAGAEIPISRGSLPEVTILSATGTAVTQFDNDNMVAMGVKDGDILTFIVEPAQRADGAWGLYKPRYYQIVVIPGAAPKDALTGASVSLQYAVTDGQVSMKLADVVGSFIAVIHERRGNGDYKRSSAFWRPSRGPQPTYAAAVESFRESTEISAASFGHEFLDGGDFASSSWGGSLVALGVQNANTSSADLGKYVRCLGQATADGQYYVFLTDDNHLVNADTGEALTATLTTLGITDWNRAKVQVWSDEWGREGADIAAQTLEYNSSYGHL